MTCKLQVIIPRCRKHCYCSPTSSSPLFLSTGNLLFSCYVTSDSATPWTAARQTPLSNTIGWSLLKSRCVLVVKNPLANAGDIRHLGSIPGSGRSPEIPCSGKPGGLQSLDHQGLDTTERLSHIVLSVLTWRTKYFILFTFWSCHVACGILVPRPGIKLTSPALEV